MAMYRTARHACTSMRLPFLNSPYGQVRYSPDSYSSLLFSCGVNSATYSFTDTGYTTPSPTARGTNSASATSTFSSHYTVQSRDTCQSIATANSISTARFIDDNNLSTLDCSVKVGQQVCLGAKCALYEVKSNDTCSSILQNQTFYQVQLTSWNPSVKILSCQAICTRLSIYASYFLILHLSQLIPFFAGMENTDARRF
jgi:hypothetical protein